MKGTQNKHGNQASSIDHHGQLRAVHHHRILVWACAGEVAGLENDPRCCRRVASGNLGGAFTAGLAQLFLEFRLHLSDLIIDIAFGSQRAVMRW